MMIEKGINTLNKMELSSGAFMAIGATAIISHAPTLPLVAAIFTTVLSLPVFISAVINYYNIQKDNKSFLDNGLLGSLYKKQITKQITQYVDDSQSPTEQKYKLIFLKEYLQAHKISGIKDLFDSDKIEEWNQTISPDYKQCSMYSYLYGIEVKNKNGSGERKLSLSDMFDEDKDNQEKIEIAHQVYQDFKNEGLLGFQMRYPEKDNMTILAELADYKLTQADIGMLQKTFNDIKKGQPAPMIFMNSDELFSILSNLALNNPAHYDFFQEYLSAYDAPISWGQHLEKLKNRAELYEKISGEVLPLAQMENDEVEPEISKLKI